MQLAIKSLCDEGKSLKTCNHYLRAIKSFSRWLNRDKRTRDDALAILEAYNAATDPRHVRREAFDRRTEPADCHDRATDPPGTQNARSRPSNGLPAPRHGDRVSSQGTPRSMTPASFEPRCRPTHRDGHGSSLEASANRLPADTPRSRGPIASLVRLSASGRTAIRSTAKEHCPHATE